MTHAQRIAAVVQGATDVTSTLNTIVHEFPRSVLDYATWYCDTHPETNTYRELITLVCCEAIVDSKFTAPNVTFPLLQFDR